MRARSLSSLWIFSIHRAIFSILASFQVRWNSILFFIDSVNCVDRSILLNSFRSMKRCPGRRWHSYRGSQLSRQLWINSSVLYFLVLNQLLHYPFKRLAWIYHVNHENAFECPMVEIYIFLEFVWPTAYSYYDIVSF